MSIQATADVAHTIATTDTEAKRGFWARFFSGLVAAREREARLRVSQHMAGMSDYQLRQIGYNEKEIGTLRSTGGLPKFYDI